MLKLAFKLLLRDWRAGELTLLLASLIVAVSTVTTITLFTDRLQRALVLESASFIAADRVISSPRPIANEFMEKATELGLTQSRTLSFLSMAFVQNRSQFTAVKAVDENYPLRGRLIAGPAPFESGSPVSQGPVPGEVWMESRLFPSLGLSPGDHIELGMASFPATRVLLKEPDRGGGFSAAGPRILMNLLDVEATKVVQPGSRLTYRYLFAGEPQQLDTFEKWAGPRLADDSRLIGAREGAQSVGDALQRAESFLLLGGLLGVVLAGVAIALSAQRYSTRHFDHVAILKTLGATPVNIDSLFFFIFMVIGLTATAVGSLVGYLMQVGVITVLGPLIPVELPLPGVKPIWVGMITGMICLLSFAFPPLQKLRSADPMRVIRRDVEPSRINDALAYLAGGAGTLALMWWYSGDLTLTLLLFSGGLVVAAVLLLIAYWFIHSGRVIGMQAGSSWRLALAGMQRRGRENAVQILTFGLAIMLLLVLFLVRTSLIKEWQNQIPENSPNHFALNILPGDVASIRSLLTANDVKAQPLYPMIRGGIRSINGKTAQAREDNRQAAQGRAPRASSGRNLTWSSQLPPENEVIEGAWWDDDYLGPALVSIEQDYATSNAIRIGDSLVFVIEGRELSAEVSNIRTVVWNNLQPNFYIILSPGSLGDFPSTYMTSFFLAPGQKLVLNELIRAHPTMTVLEVDALIEQINSIITQVSLAIEFVSVLILASGAMVLLASVQASMDERMRQFAILRTLGASQRLVLGSLSIEFLALGFFAGLLAAIGAEFTVFMLETQVFNLIYSPTLALWVAGPLLGAGLIGVIGVAATRSLVSQSPVSVLRELA